MPVNFVDPEGTIPAPAIGPVVFIAINVYSFTVGFYSGYQGAAFLDQGFISQNLSLEETHSLATEILIPAAETATLAFVGDAVSFLSSQFLTGTVKYTPAGLLGIAVGFGSYFIIGDSNAAEVNTGNFNNNVNSTGNVSGSSTNGNC